MKNPWLELPHKKTFVLPQDKLFIEEFNKNSPIKYKIITNILPEPFLGNLQQAKVVLLNLNPGFAESDLAWHEKEEFILENQMNLLHKSNPPFYLLNPQFKGSGGFTWWHNHLKQFISLFGIEIVARSFVCFEYFPYHSKHYKQMQIIPSQQYSFYLVREAIKKQMPIIIMRGKRLWINSVPELSSYQYNVLNSAQNISVTKNNLPLGIFDHIVKILS